MINLSGFVSQNVTCRERSLFLEDIQNNKEELKRNIQGKRVLVIGGAGSIGSSFIRALLPFEPNSLVVVDTNENGLAELTRDLRSTKDLFIPTDYRTYPMDYSSKVFKKMFICSNGFDVVANFSAHKHVRSEKDIFSVESLLQNNILNARKLLDLLTNYPPEVFFSVSTDKAANPVNIMGASKRVLEDVIFSYSDVFPVKTARFANVAFSNGSLPAGFLARIDNLQPISAPEDVRRYFVSLEESGQICMLACFLGKNREIFFPKLRETQMMRFDTIAVKLLQELGYKPMYCSSDQQAIEMAARLLEGSKEYPVHFSKSDTSGEKEYEEFYVDGEEVDLKRFGSLGIIVNKEMPNVEALNVLYQKMLIAFEQDTTKEEIVNILSDYLPNFKHIEMGKSLDSKM